MRSTVLGWIAAAIVGLPVAFAAEKPRIFLTESGAMLLSGDAQTDDVKGSLQFTTGTSSQSIEVMRAFRKQCPGVLITSSREKADFIVRFDHEGVSPTTPFVRGNKVAIFDRNEDLVYSNSTRLLGSAVKDACTALTAATSQPRP